MALFLFNGNGSLLSSRFNLLVLITLVLVCFCSYCSSSSSSSSPALVSPIFDTDSSIDDDDEMNYYSPSDRFINIPEFEIYPSKDSLRNLLLKSIIIQHKINNNKRYVSQSFHALRG